MSKYLVSIEMDGETVPVGTLGIFENRGRAFYRFGYADQWIDHPLGFAIDPMISFMKGVVVTENRLLGSFQDISPDRWGRLLQKRAKPGYTSEIGFMIGVSDSMRLGALRISSANTPEIYINEQLHAVASVTSRSSARHAA